MTEQVRLINSSVQDFLTEKPRRNDSKYTAGTKLGYDRAQQTTAVTKQMLFMYSVVLFLQLPHSEILQDKQTDGDRLH